MAASDTNPYDIDPARRPSVEDMGSALLVDDVEDPPAMTGEMPYADMLNRPQDVVPSIASVSPSVRLTIDFATGDPFVSRIVACGSAIVGGDFSLVDNAVGDTTISWTASKLPPTEVDPQATVNEDGDTTITAVEVTSTSVRVRTRTAGTLADVRFTLTIC